MTPEPVEFVWDEFRNTEDELEDVLCVFDPNTGTYLGCLVKRECSYVFNVWGGKFIHEVLIHPTHLAQILDRINSLTVSGPDAIQKD